MASFLGNGYVVPGVYTRTNYEAPDPAVIASLKIPIMIGTGNEILYQQSLEVIRGSSSSIDQKIIQEDLSGRSVTSITLAGRVNLGDFDGSSNRVQVKNYPIVSGDGTGTTSNKRNSVLVTINGQPVVVSGVDGTKGVITLAQEPLFGDEVRVTYFFKRTDTYVTDDVSDQVTTISSVIRGDNGLGSGEFYSVQSGVNDTFSIYVDGSPEFSFQFPEGDFSASQIATIINGKSIGSLNVSTFVDNYGKTALIFTSDVSIKIGNGTSNDIFGLSAGELTSRNDVFYTFQGPIVDGTNSGITTTSPGNVKVTIDGLNVVPKFVDGANRAITLPFAPKAGSKVYVSYWFNAWQDTFDYLAHIGINDVLRCGITPDRNDYVNGADFILKDDKVFWGSSFLVSNKLTDPMSTSRFGENQISALLIDNKAYLSECTPVINSSVNPPTDNRKVFKLPHVPTTGDGRNSPLGSETFGLISNGRIDLPTNRPDLVQVYWGFTPQDAVERGSVIVLKVDPSTAEVTLRDPIDPGAKVWASYYYNMLQDENYTFEVVVPGGAGVGTYRVYDGSGSYLHGVRMGSKSPGLVGTKVEFPSGSELTPDVRIEARPGPLAKGPTEEAVSVTFASTQDTPALYSTPGNSPYFPIRLASDRANLRIDGSPLAGGAAGIDVGAPTGLLSGFFASYIGNEVVYDPSSGAATYNVDASNNEVSLMVDGILISAQATPGLGQTLAAYVSAINTAAVAPGVETRYTASSRFASAFTVSASEYDRLSLHYNGSTSGLSGNKVITLDPGLYNNVNALSAHINTKLNGLFVVQASGTVQFGSGGNVPQAGDKIAVGGVELTGFGGARTPGNDDFNVGAVDLGVEVAEAINDPLNSFSSLCTAVSVPASGLVTITAVPIGALGNAVTFTSTQPLRLIVSGTGLLSGGLNGCTVTTTSNSSGQLVFKFEKESTDAAGYLEFISDATPVRDFAILAGVDTAAAASGVQTKLYHGPIAKRFTIAGAPLYNDRLVLRSRLVPGQGTISHFHNNQSSLVIQGSSGKTETGLVVGDVSSGAYQAVVQPATLFGSVGYTNGQVGAGTYGDGRDGQPVVTFFDGTGSEPANHVFKVNVDGTPVTVVFTASDVGVETPLGPISIPTTIIGQINAALVASGITSAVSQEGCGLRLISKKTDQFSYLEIGNGSSNSFLGFTDGSSSVRSDVSAEVLASALMAHHAASLPVYLLEFNNPTATYFAAEALAGVVKDVVGQKYLWIQSQTSGSGSSVAWLSTTGGARDILRHGTKLLVTSGSGAVGENGLSGFYVTSTDPVSGSGSANNSVFNTGVGQDGFVGQTYRDLVTGLTFTVLPRQGGIAYPDGESFSFLVNKTFTTNSNIPTRSIPGVDVVVSNTSGMTSGDLASFETFERGGLEPANGDPYYVSYSYTKQNFDPQIYTRLSAIESAFGERTPDYPISLASYLSIINGAVAVAVKQVRKDDGLEIASQSKYVDALLDLESPLPGGISPDIIVPLTGMTQDLMKIIDVHCSVQSGVRFKQERTAILGFQQPMNPESMGIMARTINSDRIRLVYPESVLLTTTDSFNKSTQYLVDGYYVAAGLSGAVVSPNVDVATPWTNRLIVGFDELGRKLTNIQADSVASNGVTVVVDRNPNLLVREGLTTDMSNVLTREPTIRLVADEIQQRARRVLGRFIGTKFLPGILNDIERDLSTMYRSLEDEKMIAGHTGVSATLGDTVNTAIVDSYWQPLFALLYIQLTFNLRSSLG